jgi:DNA polymerase I
VLARLLSAAQSTRAVRLMRAGWAALDRLPYRYIVCSDTEFHTGGDPHRGWCWCGVELRSGREFRIWLDGQDVSLPFPLDESTLFVAFVAGAEIATLRARGVPMPARIFDVFQEFRLISNTGLRSNPFSLEAACAYCGIGISPGEHVAKKRWQAEAQERTKWPFEMRGPFMGYCFNDALHNARVFLCTLAEWLEIHAGDEERNLHEALNRGMVAGVLAEAELRGIPLHIDWNTFRDGREFVFQAMVEGLQPPLLRGIYEDTPDGPVQNVKKFAEAMAALGLTKDWPLTETGLLSTTKHVLPHMLAIPPDPEIEQRAKTFGVTNADLKDLGEVMKVRSRLALLQYEVGADGRARCPFFPGTTATGRNVPPAKRFIYNAPTLFRFLIQSHLPGHVVVSFDYRAEESALVGGLANCELMLEIYATEDDVHLGCAKRARLIPPDATAKSHAKERKAFKACNLGIVYGARPPRIAITGMITPGEAQYFYDMHRAMFMPIHGFCEDVISHTRAMRLMVLPDGWRKRTVPPFRPTVASNFPVQGTAACILRRAILACYRAGLPLIATVHDSLVFEVRIEDVEALVRTVTRVMGDASEWFVPGLRLKVDVSASLPLPHLAHLGISPLVEPELRPAYERYLARAAASKTRAA